MQYISNHHCSNLSSICILNLYFIFLLSIFLLSLCQLPTSASLEVIIHRRICVFQTDCPKFYVNRLETHLQRKLFNSARDMKAMKPAKAQWQKCQKAAGKAKQASRFCFLELKIDTEILIDQRASGHYM